MRSTQPSAGLVIGEDGLGGKLTAGKSASKLGSTGLKVGKDGLGGKLPV